MNDRIRTTRGDFIHPLDGIQRRRWRPPSAHS